MAELIQIQLNGEQRSCRADATVGDLLRELAIRTERVAVELNLEIMDRKDFEHRSLKQGDRVEVLSFIGGGAPADAQRQSRLQRDDFELLPYRWTGYVNRK